MNDIQLSVNDVVITGSDIMGAIDDVLRHLEETGDLEFVANSIQALMGIEKVSGMGIARLLKGVQSWWERTDQDEKTGDTFTDWAFSVSTDFNRRYLERCIAVQSYVEQGVFTDRIEARPLKDQQAIASHLDQGYELDEDAWEELEDATDNNEVLRILREAKGNPPRKNSLSIKLDRKGTFTVWYRDVAYHGGYWKLPETADSEEEKAALKKALNRLIKGAGVNRQ